jgi:hypothetical protein
VGGSGHNSLVPINGTRASRTPRETSSSALHATIEAIADAEFGGEAAGQGAMTGDKKASEAQGYKVTVAVDSKYSKGDMDGDSTEAAETWDMHWDIAERSNGSTQDAVCRKTMSRSCIVSGRSEPPNEFRIRQGFILTKRVTWITNWVLSAYFNSALKATAALPPLRRPSVAPGPPG